MTTEQPSGIMELVSKVTEFNDLSEFMQDEDLDRAMAYIVMILAKPDVNAARIPKLIVELQAMSAKFGMLGQFYQTYRKGASGSPNYIKKNVYYSARDNIDRLVDALKYMVRYN